MMKLKRLNMKLLKRLIRRLKCLLLGCQEDKPNTGGGTGGGMGGGNGGRDTPDNAPPIERR